MLLCCVPHCASKLYSFAKRTMVSCTTSVHEHNMNTTKSCHQLQETMSQLVTAFLRGLLHVNSVPQNGRQKSVNFLLVMFSVSDVKPSTATTMFGLFISSLTQDTQSVVKQQPVFFLEAQGKKKKQNKTKNRTFRPRVTSGDFGSQSNPTLNPLEITLEITTLENNFQHDHSVTEYSNCSQPTVLLTLLTAHQLLEQVDIILIHSVQSTCLLNTI